MYPYGSFLGHSFNDVSVTFVEASGGRLPASDITLERFAYKCSVMVVSG